MRIIRASYTNLKCNYYHRRRRGEVGGGHPRLK